MIDRIVAAAEIVIGTALALVVVILLAATYYWTPDAPERWMP
jgi:hypothetical protein